MPTPRTCWLAAGTALLALLVLTAAPGLAQAPTTGSINGTVTDNTGGVLPGVTVTVSGPALMGTQTTVTNEQGQYRFPALNVGTYRLTYELPGFATVIREGIQVSIGFTATVNVQMAVAAVEETVTVSGASPVVDVQNTNIQNVFNAEMLRSIPNQRDIWGLIAVAPGTTVDRFDVGGSTAGTQTGYTAYGTSGQVRIQIDGVNTTEGTGGSAFYYDYGAFDEVQLGTDSNDASMPTPGVFLNTVLKSGGNEFRGETYVDFETDTLQGRNVDDRQRRLGAGEGDRITRYFDPNFNAGGPFQHDKFWYFTSWRYQRIGTTVTGFPVENPGYFDFATRMEFGTYKLTYQFNQNNKLAHYLQVRRKLQPHRGASSTSYSDAPYKQESISHVSNVEWSSIVSPRFFFNARLSRWGYNWGNYALGVDGQVGENIRNRMSELATGNAAGGAIQNRTKRGRWQFDWTGTLFRDEWAGANHMIKVGYQTEWEEAKYLRDGYKDAILLTFNSPSGAPDFTTPYRVTLYNVPHMSLNNLFHQGAYVQDQIGIGKRVTVNAGLRWDYYTVSYPEETINEGRFRDFFYAGAPLPNSYATPASYPSFEVPARDDIITHRTAFGPRFGVAWDVQGNGKTVLKANWGRYYYNPGAQDAVNPVQSISYVFGWRDVNLDRQFTLNEVGSFVSSSGGVRNTIDPDIGHPYTDDMSVWLERELVPNLSGRVGFVYKRQQNGYQSIEVTRVGSLFTGVVSAYDPGPDGIRGNEDDKGAFTVYDIPAGVPVPASFTDLRTPDDNDADYKSIDLTVNKRMTERWSLVSSFLYTWNHNLLFGHPQNPNEELSNEYRTTDWAFKVFGTYRAPWGVVVSPVLRHQGGDSLRRIVQVTGLRAGTFNYTAEPMGAYREDNVTIFDTRLEKVFKLPDRREVALFFDAFNLLNSNAAQDQDNITGRRTLTLEGERVEYQRFLRPTTIIGPRVYRLGFKLSF